LSCRHRRLAASAALTVPALMITAVRSAAANQKSRCKLRKGSEWHACDTPIDPLGGWPRLRRFQRPSLTSPPIAKRTAGTSTILPKGLEASTYGGNPSDSLRGRTDELSSLRGRWSACARGDRQPAGDRPFRELRPPIPDHGIPEPWNPNNVAPPDRRRVTDQIDGKGLGGRSGRVGSMPAEAISEDHRQAGPHKGHRNRVDHVRNDARQEPV